MVIQVPLQEKFENNHNFPWSIIQINGGITSTKKLIVACLAFSFIKLLIFFSDQKKYNIHTTYKIYTTYNIYKTFTKYIVKTSIFLIAYSNTILQVQETFQIYPSPL